MSLASGTRLGPYAILGPLGAGGMGEVFKARDTRLDRIVAIKILPPDAGADTALFSGSASARADATAGRRARLEREAKVIAGLNHPHICVLHDVGEHPLPGSGEATLYLVMEYLEGQTLAERLAKGPLPLRQALAIGVEIADALSAAHRRGVVHRDLKPGNVMLTKGGSKLLDFGLAKLVERPKDLAASLAVTAVRTVAPATTAGTLLGTVPYMAPEQLEGREADARSDIFSFGAVLYEMLAGTRAFGGDSQVGVMAAILEHEPPPLASVRPDTPGSLERTIRKCLAKDPEARWQDAGDVRDELWWISEAPGAAPGAPAGRSVPRATLLACGALLMAGIGAAAALWLRPPALDARVVRVTVDVGPAEEMNAGGVGRSYVPPPGSRTSLTWTPDGQSLVFVGRQGGVQRLYLRRLEAAEAQAIPGTEGGQVPAVSPDGRWVAFWAPNALKKVPIAGGPAMDLLPEANPPKGLVWSGDGQLYFARVGSGLWRVPASGGSPTVLTQIGEAERSQILSSLLPGERVLLYTARKRDWTWGDEEVVALDLATGRRKVLVRDAADARYVATGHLVFLRRGVLSAVAFDAGRLEPVGGQLPLLDAVSQSLLALDVDNATGAGQFAVSARGALAWVPRDGVLRYHQAALVSVDRKGQVTDLGAPVRMYGSGVRVSPDGRRLAVSSGDLSAAGVWLFDIARAALTPLERRGETLSAPVFWSPDGQRVIFGWLHGGRFSLAWQAADADGGASPATAPAGSFTATGWASSHELIGVTGGDLAVAEFQQGVGPVRRLFETPDAVEQSPEVSPDGRWLAYASNAGSPPGESRRFDLYVQRYQGGGRTLVGQGGGSPAWSRDGREIFYVERVPPPARLRMMAVDFQPGEPPRLGKPRLLFEYERNLPFVCSPARCYDVAPDGQRFYATRPVVPPLPRPVSKINIVFNWSEELKAKAPR
jgi:eukaryotic-like serine/threonine-protein kinase